MATATYLARRGQLETYFDRTASEAWARLTSDAKVSGIRATVRAGRDRIRNTLLDWLPADLRGVRVLDAGCGTGALAVEAARRGAAVTAIDLSATLIDLACARAPHDLGAGSIDFQVGDMTSLAGRRFDHVVAMDSLIHYCATDMARAAAELAGAADKSIVFTFAPRTPMLTMMHATGRLFPRGDRAPSIEPISTSRIVKLLSSDPGLADWARGRDHRVSTGFYISHALEWRHA